MFPARYLLNVSSFNLLNRNFRIKFSSKVNAGDVFSQGPIKYSQSPASKYKAKTTRTGVTEPRLWYEPHVILTSIAIFLIYFTALREENDVDQELRTSLYSRISGLEEHQLKLSLQYNEEKGLETNSIISRLNEIEKERSGAGSNK